MLELRPRSATEIVDASFQILRTSFTPLVTLSVAAQIPVLVIRIWAVRMGFMAGTASTSTVMSMIGSIMIFGVLLVLLAILAQCAVLVAASQAYLGDSPDAGAAVSRALSRFLPLLLTYLLVGVGFAVVFAIAAMMPGSSARGLIFLVLAVVAIFVGLRLIPLNSVGVLEDAGPIDIVKRTLHLGQGMVGHMFLTMFLGGLIYIGIAIVAQLLVSVIGAVVPAVKDPNVQAIFQTAAGALVYPLVVVISVSLYYDLRIRKEGFDVEMMSRAAAR